jgi:hypothetical protein
MSMLGGEVQSERHGPTSPGNLAVRQWSEPAFAIMLGGAGPSL